MYFRPFLMLARGRLIALVVLSLLTVLLDFYMVSATNFSDLGVFWHHLSENPPIARDAYSLLSSWNIVYPYLGAVLGFVPALNAQALGSAGAGPFTGNARLLLTRPVSRAGILLYPLAIATGALALIPALSVLLLIGWLSLVHAPALGHLVSLLELVPSASALGAHPSFIGLLAASHVLRYYLAGFSIGLCSYAAESAVRWLNFSPSPWLRSLGFIPFLALCWGPLLWMRASVVRSAVLMLPRKGASLDLQPSMLAIALHLAFAVAVLYGSWRLLQRTEL